MDLLTVMGYTALLVAVASLVGFGVGRFATHLGQSFWPFFFIGVIFWPGALLLLLLISLADRKTQRPAKPPTRKRCPDCAESVQAAANVCKHCGYRFAEAPTSA